MATTLGLDLGTNSIGWALVENRDDGISRRLIASGVRIFSECVDAKTRTPKNHERRAKRQLRRQLARRRQRRDLVRGILLRHGLLPADLATEAKPEVICNRLGDPYRLRAEGLDRALTLHEFGRVLEHLSKHRGFKSNRKADRKGDAEAEKESTATGQGVRDLDRYMSEANCRTLGEYLAKQAAQRNHGGERAYYTSRAMYEQEFELLWGIQVGHHPNALTDALYVALKRGIFHQRPLKSQAGTIGGCALESMIRRFRWETDPTTGKKIKRWFDVPASRASMAWQEAQRSRYWQDLNHLAIRDPVHHNYRPLTIQEKRRIAEELEIKPKLTWKAVRKLIGKVNGTDTLTDAEKFNIEEGGKEGLLGNRTAFSLRKCLEEDWDKLGEAKQTDLITDLMTIDNEEALLGRLQEHWGFDRQTASGLATTRLEDRPGRLSLKAIRKILPHLQAGLNYHDACQKAGYERRDQRPAGDLARLDLPPNIRNPVVQKALFQVRKVVNAVIAVYGGLPSVIRVEMARDLKQTPKDSEKYQRQMKSLERDNRDADDFWGQRRGQDDYRANHDEREKYRLWKELHDVRTGTGGVCPYTGRTIGQEMLASDEVQIEHILPFSRCLDDSFINKTLCFAGANADKGQRTPWEWLGGDHVRWTKLMERVRNMHPGKRKRFEQRECQIDDFVSRQLNDTRYICRAVKDYLARLGTTVEVSKGAATAALRYRWNLNRILSDEGTKNRNDHRHHAIDACVIACTSLSLLKAISSASAAGRGSTWKRCVDEEAWPGFRAEVQSLIASMIVSHAVNRSITDALHDDSAYGRVVQDGKESFRIRKPIEALTPAMLTRVCDGTVRACLESAIIRHGSLIKAAAVGVIHRDGKTPIKRVRIDAQLKVGSLVAITRHGVPFKFHEPNNNHRLEIWSDDNGNLAERIIRMIDHARIIRIMETARRRGLDPIQALPESLRPIAHGPPGRLALKIHTGDMVMFDGKIPCRIDQLSHRDYTLRRHTDARESTDAERFRIRSLPDLVKRIQLIHVDVLGRVMSHDQARSGDRQPGSAAPDTSSS